MKEDIIHKLEASGARAKISVKTMNGEQTHLSTAVDRLEVLQVRKRGSTSSGSKFQSATQLQTCQSMPKK